MNIKLARDLWKALKIRAAENECTLRQLVDEILRAYVSNLEKKRGR